MIKSGLSIQFDGTLDPFLLLYWKLVKFKKFVKDTFLYFQSLNSDVTWDSLNFNLLEELEASRVSTFHYLLDIFYLDK